ncbi:hypothetical protein [Xanthobacter wiegelii]|uniref:hypothetical protein n=1 Tax=Xanthobacter wiegelii TaxID=3119913 RepID=UPI00372AC01D
MANEFEISDTLFEVLKAREARALAERKSPRQEQDEGHAAAIAFLESPASDPMGHREIARAIKTGTAAVYALARDAGYQKPSPPFLDGFRDGLSDAYHSYQRRNNATPH